MSYDINRKKVAKNAYRVTKNKNFTALRVRIPGGKVTGDILQEVGKIAEKYGNGRVHMTTRQGFEILGIPWSDMQACNEAIQIVINKIKTNQPNGINQGYPAAGTRNIVACIGNEVCPKAQYNTTEFAQEIEQAIFPNDLHFKVAFTGCMNDCQKVRLHDFGIMGMCLPELDIQRCISCEACAKKCQQVSTNAIEFKNYKPVRDHQKCIGCGECVLACPTQAWSRSKDKFYRLAIMGRTGKKNPRLAQDWLIWVNRDAIKKIIVNTYDYVEQYIDKKQAKEHIGYIVDRTGFMEYKKWALKDVTLNKEAFIKNNLYWSGINYKLNDIV